jgi:hypothetical protein
MQLNSSLFRIRAVSTQWVMNRWVGPAIFILLLLAFASLALLGNHVSAATVMDTLFAVGQIGCLLFLLIGGGVCVMQAMGKARERDDDKP